MSFEVDPGEVRNAAESIDRILRGVDAGSLGDLRFDARSYGHPGLARQVGEFCKAAALAADMLRANAEAAGVILRDTANSYANSETRRLDMLRQFPDGGR